MTHIECIALRLATEVEGAAGGFLQDVVEARLIVFLWNTSVSMCVSGTKSLAYLYLIQLISGHAKDRHASIIEPM